MKILATLIVIIFLIVGWTATLMNAPNTDQWLSYLVMLGYTLMGLTVLLRI